MSQDSVQENWKLENMLKYKFIYFGTFIDVDDG